MWLVPEDTGWDTPAPAPPLEHHWQTPNEMSCTICLTSRSIGIHFVERSFMVSFQDIGASYQHRLMNVAEAKDGPDPNVQPARASPTS